MRIVFSGDRSSVMVKRGKFFRRLFPKLVSISLWDGYSSYLEIFIGGLQCHIRFQDPQKVSA